MAPIAHADAPIQPYDLSTKEGVKNYIVLEASKQGVGALLPLKVVYCESEYYGWAVGDHGLAHGLGQFHEETFYRLQKQSGLDPYAKWDDYRAQLDILIWSVNHGHGKEWTCYRKLT